MAKLKENMAKSESISEMGGRNEGIIGCLIMKTSVGEITLHH